MPEPQHHSNESAFKNDEIAASPSIPHLSTAESDADSGATRDGWSEDDIEQAYLKALQIEEDLGFPAPELEPGGEGCDPGLPLPAVQIDAAEGEQRPTDLRSADSGRGLGEARDLPQIAAVDNRGVLTPPSIPTESTRFEGEPAARDAAAAAPHLKLAEGTTWDSLSSESGTPLTPAQVIEAVLFVGGGPLTARRLCSLLRGNFESDFIERTIDELNMQYSAEARPYEIRLGDGGYRLELRAEYERLRNRVYGAGPREVKLSQEVLEVLALVAYKQPITAEEIESHGKKNAGNVLRQLLRRELIAIQRGEHGPKDVQYHTTDRFLSLFGLGNLGELPQIDDIDLK